MMRKKGQIKLGESMAIIVIFFFLIVFGLSFYMRVQKHSFDEKRSANLDLKTIQLVQQTIFIPEIQCTQKNVGMENCFDVMKLRALISLIDEDPDARLYYYDLMGFSEINITPIYPDGPTIEFYNNPKEDADTITSTKMAVTLYDAATGKYSFGILSIYMYG